ncbi:hypothetical protein GQ457_12G007170 [Hibiscus cannabinus]
MADPFTNLPPKDQPPTTAASQISEAPLSLVQSPPCYRGIRCRGGKWVSEIREPRKTTRIWLGTYPTPEMAATAYDVAAIALKGPGTDLNFPDMILSYPKVASTSATDIRAAAARAAAASRLPRPDTTWKQDEGTTSSSCMESGWGVEYIDEEELLNFPNLLVDMAGGMLVTPPRINSPPSHDSPENSDIESLWTY